MKKILPFLFAMLSSLAIAQSSPGLVFGQIPTAGQWNSYFSNKLDYSPSGNYPSINLLLSAPPAIGITTPNLGYFTSLNATGHVTFEGVTSAGSTGNTNLVFSASPVLTGVPTAPTQSPSDNSNALATTAWVSAKPFLTGGSTVNIGDANCTSSGPISSSVTAVMFTAAFTAPRTCQLPLAANVPNGQGMCFYTIFSGITSTNTLTITASGSDIIDRANGSSPTSVLVTVPGNFCAASDGNSKWAVWIEQPASCVMGNPDGTSHTATCMSPAATLTLLGLGNTPQCGSANPSAVAGDGAGVSSSGSVSFDSQSSNCAGQVVVTTGTTPQSASPIVTVTFSGSGFTVGGSTVHAYCTISEGDDTTSRLVINGSSTTRPHVDKATVTPFGFIITSGPTALPAGTYRWKYTCGPGISWNQWLHPYWEYA